MLLKRLGWSIPALVLAAGSVQAGLCDYKPSKSIGKAAAAAGATIAGGTAVAGAGLQAAGYYTLVHAGSGLTMLGSTAAGASAAGTVGIIAGTAGVIGTVGSFLLAPVTIVVGGVTFAAVGAYEGICYFQVERVTDPYEVRRIIESVAEKDDKIEIAKTGDGDAMLIATEDGSVAYLLRNLYIADATLMYRRGGPLPNQTIGPILYQQDVEDEAGPE